MACSTGGLLRGRDVDSGHSPLHRLTRYPRPIWPPCSSPPRVRHRDRTVSRSGSWCCATGLGPRKPARCWVRRSVRCGRPSAPTTRTTGGAATIPSSPKGRMAASMQHFVDHIQDAPVIVLACAHLRHGGHFAEGGSMFPACQNLLLVGAGPRIRRRDDDFHHPVEAQLAEIVGVPDGVTHRRHDPARSPVGTPWTGASTPVERAGVRGRMGRGRAVGRRPTGHPPHRPSTRGRGQSR